MKIIKIILGCIIMIILVSLMLGTITFFANKDMMSWFQCVIQVAFIGTCIIVSTFILTFAAKLIFEYLG